MKKLIDYYLESNNIMEQLINNTIEYVKNYFKNESSGHDFFHTLRVFKLAKQIAIKENANVNIVLLASLLHDVDDIKISANTHKNKDNAKRTYSYYESLQNK